MILGAAEYKTAEVIDAGSGGTSSDECGHINWAKPFHNCRETCAAQIKAAPRPGLFGDRGLAFDFFNGPLE